MRNCVRVSIVSRLILITKWWKYIPSWDSFYSILNQIESDICWWANENWEICTNIDVQKKIIVVYLKT